MYMYVGNTAVPSEGLFDSEIVFYTESVDPLK